MFFVVQLFSLAGGAFKCQGFFQNSCRCPPKQKNKHSFRNVHMTRTDILEPRCGKSLVSCLVPYINQLQILDIPGSSKCVKFVPLSP